MRDPMTESDRLRTPIGWKILGVVGLVPGLLAITILDLKVSGWQIPIRHAFKGAWEDWRTAFFDDPTPGIRTQRKPHASSTRCSSSQWEIGKRCDLPAGHEGKHRYWFENGSSMEWL